jgi:hypothetical protein
LAREYKIRADDLSAVSERSLSYEAVIGGLNRMLGLQSEDSTEISHKRIEELLEVGRKKMAGTPDVKKRKPMERPVVGRRH